MAVIDDAASPPAGAPCSRRPGPRATCAVTRSPHICPEGTDVQGELPLSKPSDRAQAPVATLNPRATIAHSPVFRLPTRVLISGAVVLRPPDNHRFSALQTPRASAAEAYFHPLFVPRSYPRPAQGFHPPYTALWTKFVDKVHSGCSSKRREGMGLKDRFVLIAKLAQHRVVLVELVIAKAINSRVAPLGAFGV